MTGETRLTELIQGMLPRLNTGDYVFVLKPTCIQVPAEHVIGLFQEKEGTTLILERQIADDLELTYGFVSAWITLDIHSSLEAVGLTAAVSNVLAKNSISCNIVAALYHDHIFVDKSDGEKAMKILNELSQNFKDY